MTFVALFDNIDIRWQRSAFTEGQIVKIGIVGSREFNNYSQLNNEVSKIINKGDLIVSGGAIGADSMAQRWAKENGHSILIHYPDYETYGKPATFMRNTQIAEDSDIIIAFYRKGHPQEGGTWDTVKKIKKLGKECFEFEEISN